ncbi:MAG: 3-deoxy-D-manno-octulosonic acid transferase [Thermodesulfobacteriota bacterium]|nr:3-deoxy-D-manno-octulosonic acid transferase [Thermodesulfobacteriota bacterium]
MYILYNIFILTATLVLSPIILFKLIRHRKYRAGLLQRLGYFPLRLIANLDGKKPIWLHAVSVGEVLVYIPLIDKIKEEYPEEKILISTVTETGNFTAKKRAGKADCIIYFPLDYLWAVKYLLKKVNPKIFLATETEIWPNFFWELKKKGIPTGIINGRISPKSFKRYIKFYSFFKKVLEGVNFFCMQTKEDYERIIAIGAASHKVVITGSQKFDQETIFLSSEDRAKLKILLNIPDKSRVFIAGSTHKGEEEIVLEVFKMLKRQYPDLVLILAPRHPERFQEVENLSVSKKVNLIRRTRLRSEDIKKITDGILLDTIGELSKLYSIGTLVFVGGSLVDIGGHNLLEPVQYKKAVLFGPFVYNFADISQELINEGGGIKVYNKEELYKTAKRLLNNEEELNRLGEGGHNIIERNRGANEKNLAIIKKYIQ